MAVFAPARPAPVAHAPRVALPRWAKALPGTAGLLLALGATGWLAVAAAQRPSVLAPPSLRADVPWLLGPLHGLLPGLSSSATRLHVDQSVALGVLAVGWALAWAGGSRLPLKAVAGVTGLAQLITVLGPPQALTDVFNYLQYGRMAADGQNPYVVLPAARHPDALLALSNWHHLPSPYGPLFTVLSEPLGLLGPETGLWLWKAIELGCSLGVLALVAHLAGRLGRSRAAAVAAVGLCPLTLPEGLGGLHNDLPVLVCLLGAVALVLRGRERDAGPGWDASAALLGCAAAGLKPSFAVVLPLLVLGARRRGVAFGAAAVGGALLGLLVLLAFGGHEPAVGLQGRLVTPLSVPNLLGLVAGHGGADAAVRAVARAALVVVVLGAVVAVAQRRERLPAALGVVLLAAALSLAWVMPWYLGWCLPFAALARPRWLPGVAVVGALWLGVGASPQMPKVIHAFGYFPTRTATGLANHRFEEGLVR